eukprot:5883829-Amphidinium_carterae.1
MPALDADALRLVYDANRGVDLTSSRLYVPKPGPKPPGEIPPCNYVEPAYIDEEHRLAAVRAFAAVFYACVTSLETGRTFVYALLASCRDLDRLLSALQNVGITPPAPKVPQNNKKQ